MEAFLLEKQLIEQGVAPVDINSAGATGARVKLDNSYRVAFLIAFNNGAGEIDATIQQHDAASAGNSKALAVSNPYYLSVDGGATYAKTEPTSAASNYTPAGTGSAAGYFVLEVLAEDLDRANDYAWVSLNLADPSAAKIVAVDYVKHDMRKKPAYS